MRLRNVVALSICGLSLTAPQSALAQDADNAVASADDAFGTSTGHEQIGVYDEGNVRGFSPGSAGNYRIEGMYFDNQGGLGIRVNEGSTIRVGPAVQGYAFPAPTGVVDIHLKKANDRFSVAPFLTVDQIGSRGIEVDFQLPISGNRLALASGFEVSDVRFGNGGRSEGFNSGGVLRWRPRPGIEVLAFANFQQFSNETASSIYVATTGVLPPRMKRSLYTGPEWAQSDGSSHSFGLLGHASLGNWTLRTGLFRSGSNPGLSYTNLIFVNARAVTDRAVFAAPESSAASWSGEVRLSRLIADGARQHLVTLLARGRSIDSRYGGGDLVGLGTAGLDEVIDPPIPAFGFSQQTDDQTRQSSVGIAYNLKWNGIGEFTVGMQRTHYVKRVAAPLLPLFSGESAANLPYISAAIALARDFTVYGSFVRGLEDAGAAPDYASNANEILPATRTQQFDFGLRWSPVKDTTVILGLFQVSKPYIDIDTANRFGVLGQQVHKGIEFSVTTSPTKDLRIVAGGVWLDPQVEASAFVAQPVGARPVGQPRFRSRFNVNWTLPFARSLTLDAYVSHDAGAFATVDNLVFSPGSTRFGVGGRYSFNLGKRDITARLVVYNLLDAFALVPIGSGAYVYNSPRLVQVWLTTEF